DGAMHVTFGNKAHTRISGSVLSIRPLYVTENPTSPISWNCGLSPPPNGMSAQGDDETDVVLQFLPAACRP
ncbi:MAG TPA: pilin, partial [Gammaproteobacteria bacterium]|nr:pilin [Gammaproteobacteria bacterium]